MLVLDCVKYISGLIVKASEIKLYGMPPILYCITVSALYLNFKFKFINLKSFKYAPIALIKDTEGIGDQSDNSISPIKSFFLQISATLGLGNIAGSLFAYYFGGPGSAVWLLIFSMFFSVIRFNEIILGKVYKQEDKDTGITTGGMGFVLFKGFKSKVMRIIGRYLGNVYSLLLGVAVLMFSGFQLNQGISALIFGRSTIFTSSGKLSLTGILLSFIILSFVFWISINSVRKISNIMQNMIMIMVGTYLFLCLYIIIVKYKALPNALHLIFYSAFNPKALVAGSFGAIISAFNRIVLATEAGLGTGCMPYASSTEKYLARQAFFSIVESTLVSFIIAIGVLILILMDIDIGNISQSNIGIGITRDLIGNSIGFIPKVAFLLVVFCFSFTTLIGNCYYFESVCRYFYPKSNIILSCFAYISIVMCLSVNEGVFLIKTIDAILSVVIFISIFGALSFASISKHHIDIYINRIRNLKK